MLKKPTIRFCLRTVRSCFICTQAIRLTLSYAATPMAVSSVPRLPTDFMRQIREFSQNTLPARIPKTTQRKLSAGDLETVPSRCVCLIVRRSYTFRLRSAAAKHPFHAYPFHAYTFSHVPLSSVSELLQSDFAALCG